MNLTPKKRAKAHVGFRTTLELHARLKAAARRAKIPLTDLLEELLVWGLDRHQAGERRREVKK